MFTLIEKSNNGVVAKFHVMNAKNETVGSVAVSPKQVPELLRCWHGQTQHHASTSKRSPVQTLVDAFKASKRRGCPQVRKLSTY